MRTGFIDDLRNCKQCGSLEHENYLRNDLCPNCYYDVDRFKEEREKAKADNKWLNKWQKLKEWVKNKSIEIKRVNAINEEMAKIKDYIDMTYRECYIKIQELEQGEKDD